MTLWGSGRQQRRFSCKKVLHKKSEITLTYIIHFLKYLPIISQMPSSRLQCCAGFKDPSPRHDPLLRVERLSAVDMTGFH